LHLRVRPAKPWASAPPTARLRGHAMAAGLRIQRDKVETCTRPSSSVQPNPDTPRDLEPVLRLEAEVAPGTWSLDWARPGAHGAVRRRQPATA